MGASQTVGIDIGHASIRVVGLKLGKRPVFVGCKEVPLDPALVQKEGLGDPAVIGKILREAMVGAAPHAIPVSSAYAAISESRIFRKVLEMPTMQSEVELLSAVRLEAAQYLPESLETMEVDCQPLGKNADGTAEQVMVVAVNKKLIQDYIAVFAAAKLPIKAIDAKPEAVGRALVEMDEKEAVLLVEIGSQMCAISLYESGAVRVTGSLNIGSEVINDSEGQELPADKRQIAIGKLADGLADEITHVVKFYMNRSLAQRTVKEIRLSGQGSMLPEFPEALGKLLETPVVVGKALIALPPFCDRRFLVALGCAMYPLREGKV